MNSRQETALRILRMIDKNRDLYKAVDHKYWITYSADFEYEPLPEWDVKQLKNAGLITEKWTDCYALSDKAKS